MALQCGPSYYNARRSLNRANDAKFMEQFVEIMMRGEVERAPDGSEIITRPPVRKMFLIYTEI